MTNRKKTILVIPKSSIHSEITYIEELQHYLFFVDALPRLAPAKCRHEGAPLPVRVKNGFALCPRHGWILDIKCMTYANPHGLPHTESNLIAELVDETIYIFGDLGGVAVDDASVVYEYSNNLMHDADLLQVEYINHASAVFSTRSVSFVTDPWLLGSAFSTGWFLKTNTPKEKIEMILSVEYCFISHSHPDHLNPTTLLYLKYLGWNPKFIVPSFPNKDQTLPMLQSLGFSNFILLRNDDTYSFPEDQRVQLEMRFDKSGRNDSGFILRYGASTLVNLVDAPNLDLDGVGNINIIMAPFANGASGYPVCWEDLMGIDKIREIKYKTNKSTLIRLRELCSGYRPDVVIPFAGYFKSPLPEDEQIEALNTKNSPADVQGNLESFATVFNPELCNEYNRVGNFALKGSDYCMQSSSISKSKIGVYEAFRDLLLARYDDFEKSELVDFFALQEFRDNLIVDFQVCSNDFSEVFFSLAWDFRSNSEAERPYDQSTSLPGIRCLSIRVRRYSISYTIRNGLPWEEFSIGFQARFTRSPDVYNFSFWNYFQNSFVSKSRPYADYKSFFPDVIRSGIINQFLALS